MRKTILILITSYCFLSLSAQNKIDTLLLKKPLVFNKYTDYWKFMRQEHSFLFNKFSIISGSSFNTVFFPNIRIGGLTYPIRVNYFPYFLEFACIRNRWTFNKVYYPYPEKISIQRTGHGFFIAGCPLPHFHRISEIIVPYIGMGYQWFEVKLMNKKHRGSYLDYFAKMNLSSSIWKVGINIYIPNYPVDLIFEYEQNINKKSKTYKSFNFSVYIDVTRFAKRKTNCLF